MSTVNNMQIQDDEGNVFHPETSIEQIVGENGTQVFPGGKPGNMESSDMTTVFTESKMRENIKSGEKHRVLFGKIQKFFTDLKTVAFSGKYGDLSERPTLGGAAGYKVADNDTTNSSEFLSTARVAYEHGQEIDALSRDIDTILQKLSRGFRIELSIGQYIWKPENESQWHGSGDSARITLEISADGIAIAKVTNPGDFRAYGTDHGRINKVGIVSIHPL